MGKNGNSGFAADVAVLCGGPGAEREVSLASGSVVHEALVRSGLDAVKVEVPADAPAACLERLDCRTAVLMLHGEFGEDGTAQAILERRGIAFTGSDSRVSALAMDKNATKRLFVKNGIPTPAWVTAPSPEAGEAAARERGLAYPLFVKPNCRGSSVGVSRVDSPEELRPAIGKALAVDSLALVEEMVAGRELTVGWLDGRVLPTIELVAEGGFYDYRAKYVSDRTRYICPAGVDGRVAELINAYVARAAEALGVRDVARMDVLLDAGGPMFLEVNTLPGFTTHSLVPMAAAEAGIPLPLLCRMLVEMAASRSPSRGRRSEWRSVCA